MPAAFGGNGFGTAPTQLINDRNDWYYREIRANGSRVDLLGVQTEMDAGVWFIRSAGDATANGGLVLAGRLAILRGASGLTPPNFTIGSGDSPYGFNRTSPIASLELLWQDTVFGGLQQIPRRFLPHEMSVEGDAKSLYVMFGGLVRIIAGTNAVPGTVADAPACWVSMSLSGIDYGTLKHGKDSFVGRSLPRYDVQG